MYAKKITHIRDKAETYASTRGAVAQMPLNKIVGDSTVEKDEEYNYCKYFRNIFFARGNAMREPNKQVPQSDNTLQTKKTLDWTSEKRGKL